MPRLRPLDAAGAPEEVREALRGIAVSPASRIMAYWPPSLIGTSAMSAALEGHPVVDAALLRLAKLRAAQLVGCPF